MAHINKEGFPNITEPNYNKSVELYSLIAEMAEIPNSL